MFRNLGLHVIKFPSGRFGYVGSLSPALAQEVPASTAAVMGQRSHYNLAGELVEWKWPTFDTEQEARAFAKSRGCNPQQVETGYGPSAGIRQH